MSALETVARVARLRERAARAEFGRAVRVQREAEAGVQDAVAALARVAPPGAGSTGAVRGWHASASRHADAVAEARTSAAAAAGARDDARTAWQAASQRQDVLADLLERSRAERRAAADALAQRTLDDRGRRGQAWS